MDLTSGMYVGNDSYLEYFQNYPYSFIRTQDGQGKRGVMSSAVTKHFWSQATLFLGGEPSTLKIMGGQSPTSH